MLQTCVSLLLTVLVRDPGVRPSLLHLAQHPWLAEKGDVTAQQLQFQ